MNDFIGFTLDGVHSSDLGVIRVSDGSRFNMDLLPTTNDRTVTVQGRDETYYQGRDYKQASISLSIAYDNMSEYQLNRLKNIIHNKKPVELVLDERPYLTYYVLPTNNCKLNYICFPDSRTNIPIETKAAVYSQTSFERGRVYKGEGTLVFTCYDPYGHVIGEQKYQEHYTSEQLTDWNESVGLLSQKEGIDKYIGTTTNGKFVVYNPGEVEATPRVRIKLRTNVSEESTEYNINYQLDDENTFMLSGLKLAIGDCGVDIDSRTQLVYGINTAGKHSSNIYNKYITSGYFNTIPCGYDMTTGVSTTHKLTIYTSASQVETPLIFYDYKYL